MKEMTKRKYRWSKHTLRQQLSVLQGESSPSIVLENATLLNFARRRWQKANIWIKDDRIVYVGEKMPLRTEETEVVDCSRFRVVPGYIEHHAHPFQLYNPHSFAEYASMKGTTAFINDNLLFFLTLNKKKALSIIEAFDELPTSMYWWVRFDAQTELNDDEPFAYSNMIHWLEHPLVVQGGELTSWPKVLAGDDAILHWMQEARRRRKPIEGHLPGASEMTLAKMALLGVTCDHEAMTAEEVVRRLDLGYTVSLRHSSIRPDLPNILRELKESGVDYFGRCLLTTDGSSPSFYEDGIIDKLIRIALKENLDPIDAYAMASYNVAVYYGLDDVLGMVAPGRIAHLNILAHEREPAPISVLAKGKWIVRDGKSCEAFPPFKWEDYGIGTFSIDWDLKEEDFTYFMPFGIEMVNSVILKPYRSHVDIGNDTLREDHDECYFMMFDREGKWFIPTMLKGFATGLKGFASSYSMTGDIILIGKSFSDMKAAFRALKKQGGGIVVVENGEVIGRLTLDLNGFLSSKPLIELMKEEKQFVATLKKRGYTFTDPVYSLLFFSATHLPYIRVTQKGIYDVKKKTVLFPAIMR